MIGNIKLALTEEYMDKVVDYRFGRLLHMGHHTFSFMFVHYIVFHQLVTAKKYELWWTYSGKPIRYAIDDFALVRGLNCEPLGTTSETVRVRGRGKGKSKT